MKVVVVGLGAMGSAALAHLARRGHDVIGLDPNPAGHKLGSSHGGSRVVRRAYFEHPDYVPLLKRAFELWEQLEAATGREIVHRNGVLIAGGPSSAAIRLSHESALAHGIPTERLSPDELRRRFPQFALPEQYGGLLEPGGGFAVPEFGIAAQLEVASQHGAEIRFGEGATSIGRDGQGALVTTASGELRADHVVVAAGAWTESLLPQLAPFGLQPQRKLSVWFEADDPVLCGEGRMPAWLIDDDGASGHGVYYGIPTWRGQIGAGGVKVGFHGPGPPIEPGKPGEPDLALVERFHRDMSRYLSVFGAPTASMNCTYTMSRDEHFIVDTLDNLPVSFAAGFSGHGFKFAPVIGEVLADLAEGRGAPSAARFLSMTRFDEPASPA